MRSGIMGLAVFISIISSVSAQCDLNALAVDSSGGYYAIGSSKDNWVTRKSSDGGRTWATIDFITNPQLEFEPRGIVIDKSNNIFVAGAGIHYKGPSSPNNQWHLIVRISSDFGKTWRTIDDFQPFHVIKIALNPVDGAIYVLGASWGQNGGIFFRKTSDLGKSWEMLSAPKLPVHHSSNYPQSFAFDLFGKYFLSGSIDGVGFLVAGTPGSPQWKKINEVKERDYNDIYNEKLAVGPNGTIYSSAVWVEREQKPYRKGRHIRRSQDGGGSWVNLRETLATGPEVIPYFYDPQIYVGKSGDVFTADLEDDDATWIIAKSTDDGSTWKKLDEVHSGGEPWSLVQDPLTERLLVGGTTRSSNPNVYHGWVVRMSDLSGTLWQTVDDFR